LERLSTLEDDTITYQVKHGNKLRVMTPMQFMARLAALIPPPRHPLIRFHGIFAPHSRYRKQVVRAAAEGEKKPVASCVKQDEHAQAAPPAAGGRCEPLASEPMLMTEAHSTEDTRLTSRIDWATLLKRVYTVDALACPSCGGCMRFTHLYELKHHAQEELAKRGLPTHSPPLARARSPDFSWD
jgi:hypothetical protein